MRREFRPSNFSIKPFGIKLNPFRSFTLLHDVNFPERASVRNHLHEKAEYYRLEGWKWAMDLGLGSKEGSKDGVLIALSKKSPLLLYLQKSRFLLMARNNKKEFLEHVHSLSHEETWRRYGYMLDEIGGLGELEAEYKFILRNFSAGACEAARTNYLKSRKKSSEELLQKMHASQKAIDGP